MTAVANDIFTASQYNTYVKNNLLETEVAKATTAGGYFVTTAANTIAERQIASDSITTSQGTSSASYANLATTGPTVTVTTGIRAMVWMTAEGSMSSNGIGACTVTVSGATTIAAADTNCMRWINLDTGDGFVASTCFRLVLTAGSNTFTMQYKTSAGTLTAQRRELLVMPF
jgi:hypothetical protein